MEYQRPTSSLVHLEYVGRPRFDIPEEQLCSLIDSRFTVPQIADLIGVSTSTVRRRCKNMDY